MRRRSFHKVDVTAQNGTFTTIATIYGVSWATARRWSTKPGFPKPVSEGLYNLKAVASWKNEPDVLDIDNGDLLCIKRISTAFGVSTKRVCEWKKHPDFPQSEDFVRNNLGAYFKAWWKDDIQAFMDAIGFTPKPRGPRNKDVDETPNIAPTDYTKVKLINSIFGKAHGLQTARNTTRTA